jgi:hypothetical protein
MGTSPNDTAPSRPELGEDNERYAYPPSLNNSGFFEDYSDGKPEAVATFWQVVNRRLSAAA